ncbi:MAG: hypothetical protein PX636_21550, partial [Microcystis sp. M53598_WE2]|nr:hypothetical protein [Microcystis sp. M53598_WE2]
RKLSPAKYFYSSLWRGTAYVTVEGAECGMDCFSLLPAPRSPLSYTFSTGFGIRPLPNIISGLKGFLVEKST